MGIYLCFYISVYLIKFLMLKALINPFSSPLSRKRNLGGLTFSVVLRLSQRLAKVVFLLDSPFVIVCD